MPRARTASGGNAIITTTELQAALLTIPSTKVGDTVDLEGVMLITSGTGALSLIARIRQGNGITGNIVGQQQVVTVTTPGNNQQLVVQVSDTPPESTNLQYSLTIQQSGATANGNSVYCTLVGVWGY